MSSYQRLSGFGMPSYVGGALEVAGPVQFDGAVSGANLNLAALSAQDYTAYQTGAYIVDDFVGDRSATSSASGVNAAAGGVSLGTAGVPSGWTSAIFARPGLLWAQTGGMGWGAVGSPVAGLQHHKSSPLTTTVTIDFATPNVSSTATDRFVFCVGPCLVATSQYIQAGYYLRYTDNVNSGQWQLCESFANGEGADLVIANSSVAFVPATWYRARFVISGSTVSASLNGTVVASGNALLASNASYVMPMTSAGLHVYRTISSATTVLISALLDRTSVSISGTTRT